MTRRQKATETGLEPHFKVRIVLPGALLHLASRDEPRWVETALVADWIEDPDYGDSIVSMDWTKVVAVTTRWSE